MGMGFKSISVYLANPPFQTLFSGGAVSSSMFGFKLAPNGSELFLGGVNSYLFKGPITWVPLSNEVCHFKCVLSVYLVTRALLG
jgi:cathepsin D